MDRETRILIDYFPKLKDDKNFKITSPWTYDYNCIAWAVGLSTNRLWPVVEDEDGNIIDPSNYDEFDEELLWPENVKHDKTIESFIDCFRHYGFEICDNGNFENGFIKIALYQKDNECTHACRQLENGFWTSKMGPLNDIQHSTPEVLEGQYYGKVTTFMKKNI